MQMQLFVMTGMALLFWFFSVGYLQHDKQENVGFFGKKQLTVLTVYILLAIGMGWLYSLYSFSIMLTAQYTGMVYLMLLIAYIDKREWRIPNDLLVVLGVFSVCCMMIMVCFKELKPQELLWNCIFGALIGGGTFLVGYLLSRGSLGLGDVKLMLVLGFILGNHRILVCMFLSLVLSAAAGIVGIIRRKKNMKDAVAFAPFVTAALFIILILGI